MLEEKDIIYIKNEITTLESLAKILELNYENDSEICPSELWALVLMIRENLNKLSKHLENLTFSVDVHKDTQEKYTA